MRWGVGWQCSDVCLKVFTSNCIWGTTVHCLPLPQHQSEGLYVKAGKNISGLKKLWASLPFQRHSISVAAGNIRWLRWWWTAGVQNTFHIPVWKFTREAVLFILFCSRRNIMPQWLFKLKRSSTALHPRDGGFRDPLCFSALVLHWSFSLMHNQDRALSWGWKQAFIRRKIKTSLPSELSFENWGK